MAHGLRDRGADPDAQGFPMSKIEQLESELRILKSAEAKKTCPACIAQRIHTEGEWQNHPMAGTGKQKQ